MSVMFSVMGGGGGGGGGGNGMCWIQTLYFCRTKDLRTEQVDHFVLPK